MEAHIARLQATVADDRAPGAPRAPRPAGRAARPVVHARPPVLVAADATSAGCSGWPSRRVLLASIHPALVLLLARRAAGRADVAVASRRRAQRRGVGGAARPPGPPPVRRRHHGGAGEGGARHRHRRRRCGPRRRGRASDVAAARSPPPAGRRRCGRRAAWAMFGVAYVAGIAWVARGLDRSVGDVVLVVVAGQRLSQYIAQTVGELGFLRGVWLDSSLRLTWLEDYAAALERRRPPTDAAGPARRRHPLRARLVPLPRHRPAGPRRRRRAPPGRRGRRHRRRERRRQDDARQAAGRHVPARRRVASPSTASTWPRCPAPAWRARLAGAFQDFFRFELRRPPERRRRRRAAPRRRAGRRPRRRAGRRRRRRRPAARPGSTPSSARRGTTASRCRSGSGRSWRWPAGSCATTRSCSCSTSRRPRSTPRPSTPCSSATPTRRTTHAANGRITVLVSHRFSTVRMADLIVVLDGARVVEVGGHDELVARGGQYAELFAIQAGAYRDTRPSVGLLRLIGSTHGRGRRRAAQPGDVEDPQRPGAGRVAGGRRVERR